MDNRDKERKLSAVTEWLYWQLLSRWNIEEPELWFRYVRRFMVSLGFLGMMLSEITGDHKHKNEIKGLVDYLATGSFTGFAFFIGTSILFSFVCGSISDKEESGKSSDLPGAELFGAGVAASVLLFVFALLVEFVF